LVEAFDRIVVSVPDLGEALPEYSLLLGATGQRMGSAPARAWLGLSNTVVELVEHPQRPAAVAGLVFAGKSAAVESVALPNSLGLDLALCDGAGTAGFRREHPAAQSPHLSVDHVVLRTGDAQGCVALFSEQLGIRLALDKTVPEWGGRMLFFRAGKLTLEVIQSNQPAKGSDGFWGIAYYCADIEREHARLCHAGVLVSEIREGRKAGTRVATVKSHCLDIPTLLIAPV
jgi:catechol 2,3-dioxygenase-like lactoylglutathione lyase family enzyme